MRVHTNTLSMGAWAFPLEIIIHQPRLENAESVQMSVRTRRLHHAYNPYWNLICVGFCLFFFALFFVRGNIDNLPRNHLVYVLMLNLEAMLSDHDRLVVERLNLVD